MRKKEEGMEGGKKDRREDIEDGGRKERRECGKGDRGK